MSRKLWIGLALLLTTITSAEETMVPSPLEFACDYLTIDCTGIEPPAVIYTKIMGAMGLHGAYYPGEHMVFVDPVNAPARTVVHEVTHYVLHEAGIRVSRCTSEEAARRVGDAWAGLPYDNSWKQRYGCAASRAIK